MVSIYPPTIVMMTSKLGKHTTAKQHHNPNDHYRFPFSPLPFVDGVVVVLPPSPSSSSCRDKGRGIVVACRAAPWDGAWWFGERRARTSALGVSG
jgi:hypothetical protein